MSEVPRLPDYGDGNNDGDRKWLMDPNSNPESTDVVVAGHSTEIISHTGTGSEKNEGSESAESAEEQESKRLNKEIAHYYTADVFDAAEAMGMPLEHSRDSYNWSNEDKRRLLEMIEKMRKEEAERQAASAASETVVENTAAADASGDMAGDKTGDAAGDTAGDASKDDGKDEDDSAKDDTPTGGVAAAAATAATAEMAINRVATPEEDNSDNGDEEENDGDDGEYADGDDGEDAEKKKSKEKRKGLLKRLAARGIIIGLALASVFGLMSGSRNNKREFRDDTAIDQNIDDAEENETLSIQDNYDYYNNIEAKHSNVSWMNAADYVADLVNNGEIDVTTNEEGKLVFADKDAAYRTLLEGVFKMNPEQAGSIMGFGRHADIFEGFLNEGTVRAGERAIEGMDEEQQQAAMKEWQDQLKGATFEEVIWHGQAENCYIEDVTGNNHIADRNDAKACRVTSNEEGRKVLKVTFANGESMFMKINLDDAEINASKDGYVIVLKDANGNEYRYCFQPLEEKGGPVTRETPEPTPTPGPEKPTPTPSEDPEPDPQPQPGPGDPEKPEPDKPEPDRPTPTPSADEKTPFDQEKVEEGLDGLHVEPMAQEGEVSEEKPDMAEYNPETNNDGSTGAEQHYVAPDSNEQVGAQDTSELSNDGSGRTVEQTIADAETNGGANGENTSEQENRTPEDAAQQAEDAAGAAAQEEANRAYEEAKPEAEANETLSEDDLAELFRNGDF